jgi:hypothetical protein
MGESPAEISLTYVQPLLKTEAGLNICVGPIIRRSFVPKFKIERNGFRLVNARL